VGSIGEIGRSQNGKSRIELACNIGTPEQHAELKTLAPIMLEEWSRTRRAPRQAAWLHHEPKA
jgi:hypothetical protein